MNKPYLFLLLFPIFFGCNTPLITPILPSHFQCKTFYVVDVNTNDTMVVDFHKNSFSMHKEGTYQRFYRPWHIQPQVSCYELVLDGWPVVVHSIEDGSFTWSAGGLTNYAAIVTERDPI